MIRKFSYSIIIILIGIIVFSCEGLKNTSNKPLKNEVNLNIQTVVYRVEGMDSITIHRVQDSLSLVKGITRNFACYSDTIVFIEYDSSVVKKPDFIKAIAKAGFHATEKRE